MAVISLDTQQIQTLSSEISSLDTTMLENYLPQLESELNAIYANVQGEELHSIINTINSQFSNVKTNLSAELPKLEAFLEEQIKSYTMTEQELDAELSNVLNKMAAIAGTGVTVTASANTDDLQKQIDDLQAQLKEANKTDLQKANDEFLREAGADNAEFGERFINDWTNVGEAYQDGLVSGLVSTLGATGTTVGNGIGWCWNQVVNLAEWSLGAIGLHGLGNIAGWTLS